MPQYECPECGNKMKTAEPVPAGKKLRCSDCQTAFAPAAAAAAKPVAKAKPAAKPAAEPPRPKPANDDDDANPYGVVKESEEEERIASKNKPKFGQVRDKYKRSARGPAQSLLVLPSNLLIAEGGLTGVFGVGMVVYGLWPMIFTDAPPSGEEVAESVAWMFFGVFALAWGGLVCLGASRMQGLESYSWAVVGAVLGILPLLAGIFALITIRDPRVIAGFEEGDGGPNDEEIKDDDEDDDEDDEDDDEDDDD